MNVLIVIREWLQQAPWRYKIGVLAGIVVLIGAGFYYFEVTPKLERLAALEQKIKSLTARIEQERAKLAQLDQLKAEAERLEQELLAKKAQLPAKPEAIALLERISDLATQMGLNVKLWKPGEPVTDDSKLYVKLPVSVELAGEYHTVGRFFDRVQNSSRLMSVFNLQMGPATMDADKAAIHTVFDLAAFASEGAEDTQT